jgi:pimeloyl-ACP methyl ester carboxylesterase
MKLLSSAVLLLAALASSFIPSGLASQIVTIRGKEQTLRIYGDRGGDPVIVASGDGGWVHLGPHVADFLAAKGFYVVGLDARAYLVSFTSANATLRAENVAADFRTLAVFAAAGGSKKPILIGVSEGAGLSVLAATDPQTKAAIGGVVGLGLPDLNELAWRWRDALIYLTHRLPHEPLFSTASIADKVAPLPLGAVHSTHDEFVSVADVQNVLQHARDPKRLWVVEASDHRFSDNAAEFDSRLLEAIAWVKQNAPR